MEEIKLSKQSNIAHTPPSTPPTPEPNDLSDIFSASPPGSPASSLPRSNEPSDIPRLRSTHSTTGYRAGISASKEQFLQPGFDEGYSLGATFGLRVGYLVGVLEGLNAAFNGPKESLGGRERIRSLLEEARGELSLERVFAPEWWGEDGTWKYEVHGEGQGGEEEADVTFGQVVEWHPTIRKWVAAVEKELKRVAIGRGRFEGVEWEKGRIWADEAG
ncbi:MAG: hypothetical protein Q9163_002368 [Psora crenata]